MQKKIIQCNGILKYKDAQKNTSWEEAESVRAHVPGNVEIDLMEAGILPDIYYADNIFKLKPYEFYDWRYELTFMAQKAAEGERAYLRFGGVDCFADYYVNGVFFGHTENALIEHRFDVTDILHDGENSLTVEIFSPILETEKQQHESDNSNGSRWVRKAPSQYGWDIMPRTLLGGIWRDITLEIEEPNEIEDIYLATLEADGDRALLYCSYALKTDAQNTADLVLRLEGRSQSGKNFGFDHAVSSTQGEMKIEVNSPDLWWPYGYGEPALYDIKITLLCDGEKLTEKGMRFGIRKVDLVRTDIMDENGCGDFLFMVNGAKIMCKGSNWVPCDALHSRDASRYEKILSLFTETECNIVRTWGGNVYEDHAFFDYCDEHGLMVWQDFAMACDVYPNDREFLEIMRVEAESVVRKLRNHASIVLWSGDNECDACVTWCGMRQNPNDQKVTREVLPDVIQRLDSVRAYLPSSPYISQTAYEHWQKFGGDIYSCLPENHLWGVRDYYKSPYYRYMKHRFISEIGYHGCNAVRSIKTFISPDKLWSYKNNDEWIVHATEMTGPNGPHAYRIELMAKQIRQIFSYIPDNLADFVLMSQISQAEANKFFIESTRRSKWDRTGIIWWNIIDGWPQFSDAVVSYDFVKKLAYYYIKQSQQPVALVLGDLGNWHCPIILCNDTLKDIKGTYKAYDGESREVLCEGEFSSAANENAYIGGFEAYISDKKLVILEWEIDGVKHYNHGILGEPAFSLEKYRTWLDIIGKLYDFDIDTVIS